MTSPKFVVDFANFWSNPTVDSTLLADVIKPHSDWDQTDKDALTVELGTLSFTEKTTLLRHFKGVADSIAAAGVNCDLSIELPNRTRNYKPEWLEKCEAYAVKCFGWVKPTKIILPAPTITSITPNKGFENLAIEVIVAGTNFVDGAKVSIDGSDVPTGFVSTTELKARLLVHASGAVDVEVTNPDGQKATSPVKFTYLKVVVLKPAPPSPPDIPAPSTPAVGFLIGDVINLLNVAGEKNVEAIRATSAGNAEAIKAANQAVGQLLPFLTKPYDPAAMPPAPKIETTNNILPASAPISTSWWSTMPRWQKIFGGTVVVSICSIPVLLIVFGLLSTWAIRAIEGPVPSDPTAGEPAVSATAPARE